MAEVESIINSRPLTVETLSDINSQIPLLPSNLLPVKTNVVMPPPGVFTKPHLYSRRRWRRMQHIAEVFWQRWRKEMVISVADSNNGNQTLRRPITKIMLLVENEIDSPSKGAITISQDETSTSLEEPDINDTKTLYNIVSGVMA